ncbi:MAG: hypothetical protein LBV02_05585 [Bacteroidales bacterium]|jgi:hypothetical protein|nr:hypothetical protein [Bacteroidales bacterium]
MKKHLFLTLLFLSAIFLCTAQRVNSFSGDFEQTVTEMKALFQTASSDYRKESDALMIVFEEWWKNPFLSGELQTDFITLANEMVAKKYRPFPQFKAFINASIAYSQFDRADHFHEKWKNMISYYIQNGSSTGFVTQMEMYALVFGKKQFSDKKNSTWRFEGDIKEMGVNEIPFISFEDVDVISSYMEDSVTIASTSGIFFPTTGKWTGKGGYIYWDRTAFGQNVKAQLSDYDWDIRFAKVAAENALLYYPDLFSQPIPGAVEDKATINTDEDKATYPRFKSYEAFLIIPDIYENVDYQGGFTLRGSSIMGSTDGITLAKVSVKKDGKVVASARSTSFLFSTDNVLASDAKIAIYIENDSIYHTAANFKYTEKTRELLISRPKNGVGRAPFINTYHRMDIYAEAIIWKVDEERIEIRPMVSEMQQGTAIFESQNYFDPNIMLQMRGQNEISPLYKLWELFRTYEYGTIPFQRVVAHFKKSPADIRQLLIDVAAQGFIEYDTYKDEVTYRSKLAQYLNNDVGKRDYDNIRLESQTHYANIDLLTLDMRVTGCEFFVLSDAQIVNVYPSAEKVTVKKNRDMTFSGRVIGGLFDFVTHNCDFNYDRFVVDMDVIDSLIMYVEDRKGPVNMYGEHRLQRVTSQIEELAGSLYIDQPGNKSGIVDHPEYPYFQSRKEGKVFYDHHFNNNGAYKRDQFYFLVNLFRIVNLDNFEPDSMRFNGRLVSGGIFPDIHEDLVTRPDFSLGFVHRTGPSGLPAYGGKGHFTNMIDLSNKGLWAKGDIKYITSLTKSDSLIFFLDHANGRANSHVVEEQQAGVEFPKASVEEGYMHWQPYNDQMFIYTRETPMAIFNEIEHRGFSRLTPSGMYGNGISKFNRADLTSHNFWFKHHELLADTANLRIFDLERKSDFALTTDNYNSHIDFQTRKGVFISNGNVSEVLFVKNEMRANANRFDWDPIDDNILRFKWDDPHKDVDINNTPSRELVDMLSEGNELIATNHEKNLLRFNALNAEFDFGRNIIKADGVRFINVGDAAVIPYNGEVTIYEKADIEKFTKARILAGRENKYHELYNATVKVTTGTRFRGNGYYDYMDENETVQTIYFDTVWVINKTEGHGKVPLASDFKLSPHFGFDGRVELHSDKPFIYFVGGVEFINDCDTVKPARLRILQEVDPKNILIEIHDRSKDVNDRKAVVAIASRNRDGRIYTCFGAAKDQFNDSEYISVFGFIKYDKDEHCFKAASLEKLADETHPGNIIMLDVKNCLGIGRGAIDMGAKLGRVDFITNGTITNFMQADSAEMNLITSIDFFFNTQSMKILSKILEDNQSLNFVSVDGNVEYDLALIDIMGEEAYTRYKKESALSGRVNRLPKELQVKFLFSDIYFTWDKDNSSFVSQRLLPVIICGSTQIFKEVPGRIVIEKRGSRNRLYIFLEIDNEFFFFQFENSTMFGYSSVKQFNEEISNTKGKDRVAKMEDGKSSYTYRLGNRTQHRNFVRKFYRVEEEEVE